VPNWPQGVTLPVQVVVPFSHEQPWPLHVVDDVNVEQAAAVPEQVPPPASLAVQVQPTVLWQDNCVLQPLHVYGMPVQLPCPVTGVQPTQYVPPLPQNDVGHDAHDRYVGVPRQLPVPPSGDVQPAQEPHP
jgi:hypothetical protein